jgi:catechol 2,3-dioxygenase-like lactoylglutathione lyase family enzyme
MRKPVAAPVGRVHVHLIVSDMKFSIDFYVTVLGFFYDHGVRDVAWLTRGQVLLTLSPGKPSAESSSYFGWSLTSIEELEQQYAALRQQHQRLSAPPDPAGGRLYFFLYDPDDYPVCFSVDPLDYPLQESAAT